MLAARRRLIWLGIIQTARFLADACLAVFLVLQSSRFDTEPQGGAWLVPLLLLLAPFLVLAPVNGALSNSLPRQAVLIGSAVFCFCRTALLGVVASSEVNHLFECIGLGLIGTGHAAYSAANYALLPAAAKDTRLPLSRILGWMETGGLTGTIAGLLLGSCLHRVSWAEALAILPCPSSLVSMVEQCHFPITVAASLGFELVALVAAFGVYFPSDIQRPEAANKALAGFFHDAKILLKDRSARGSLLGLAYFMAVIVAGLLASSLMMRVGTEPIPARSSEERAVDMLCLLALGAAGGSLLGGFQVQPRRGLGLVPPATLGLVATLAWAATSAGEWVYLLLGLMGGLIHVAFRASYSAALPTEARGNGMAVMNSCIALSVAIAALFVYGLARLGVLMPAGQLWLIATLAGLGGLAAGRVFLREVFELLGEMLLWPMYRVRVWGPGIQLIPTHGPLLVIANHTSWFDPLWLAKILPRRVTPMMTSRFFDLPILHWLMSTVAGAIRVEEATYRREVPELEDAVAVLDRGGCLLLFPEGALKRRPEQSLRRFGQGVWRILRQRPQTPVIACWIEGGWESFASYYGGPPTVNKRLDWWRPIEIGIEPPQVLDPAILADRHTTREYLMRACLAARRYLGREPLPLTPVAAEQPDRNAPWENT